MLSPEVEKHVLDLQNINSSYPTLPHSIITVGINGAPVKIATKNSHKTFLNVVFRRKGCRLNEPQRA